jgi:hypothetical protein
MYDAWGNVTGIKDGNKKNKVKPNEDKTANIVDKKFNQRKRLAFN